MSDLENVTAKVKGRILDSINRNQNGDYYIIFKVPKVARGMHGKAKGHVDEVLIVGVPQKLIDDFLLSYYSGRGKSESSRISK